MITQVQVVQVHWTDMKRHGHRLCEVTCRSNDGFTRIKCMSITWPKVGEWLTVTLDASETEPIFSDVRNEMIRQDTKWGAQRTNPTAVDDWVRQAVIHETLAKMYVDDRAKTPEGVSWSAILLEEIAEAFNAPPEHLREELIQCAAVIAQWVKYLDKESAAAATATEVTE